MKKCTDITSIDFYLQGMGRSKKKAILSDELNRKTNFKILVKDDVKNSLYLIDA
jgi:hypothetical protein